MPQANAHLATWSGGALTGPLRQTRLQDERLLAAFRGARTPPHSGYARHRDKTFPGCLGIRRFACFDLELRFEQFSHECRTDVELWVERYSPDCRAGASVDHDARRWRARKSPNLDR